MKTYRWYGHSEIDPANYRTQEELEYWKKRDPLPRYEKILMERGVIDESYKQATLQRIEREIEEAIEFAEKSPHPEPHEILGGRVRPALRIGGARARGRRGWIWSSSFCRTTPTRWETSSGGRVLHWIDLAAAHRGAPPLPHRGGDVSMDEVSFLVPIRVGQLACIAAPQ